MLKNWMDYHLWDMIRTCKLPSGKSTDEELKARVARASFEALALQERLRDQGYDAAEALHMAADKFRSDCPEYASKTDQQVRRIWYR